MTISAQLAACTILPLLVTRLAANLDQLGGGRFVLGVGRYPPSLPGSALGWHPTTSTRTLARCESGASGRC
jgi:alkanesulfonate monooxygenase SsuD/methylene tetrahydromethanopterin reductase-like flavin-dependent oxidoreductase (luciferase family)